MIPNRRLSSKPFRCLAAACLLAAVAMPPRSGAQTGPTLRSAAGQTADAVRAAVEQFRTDIGGGTTAGANGSFGGLRREINWDAVPDNFAAPNDLPLDFFNTRSPRGAVFSTPGSSVLVSSRQASGVPVRFGDINATYVNDFGAFSPERIFGAAGSTVTEVSFFVPGTQNKATVRSFGVVFTDVDSPESTKIDYFDSRGTLLFTAKVPEAPGKATFSFAGATFDAARVARVKITSGGALLSDGVNDGPISSRDKVAMDDFLYSEPVAVPPQTGVGSAEPAGGAATTVAVALPVTTVASAGAAPTPSTAKAAPATTVAGKKTAKTPSRTPAKKTTKKK